MTGVGVTAAFATTGNGIILTDTAGGAGTLTVTSLNDSTVAADLGLTAAATAGGTTIVGTDVNPVETSGIFSDLANLRNALNSSNQQAITAAAEGLQNDYNQIVTARGVNGAGSRRSHPGKTTSATRTWRPRRCSRPAGRGYTTAVTQFQTLQTSLQATLMSTAKVLNMSLLNFLG